MMRSTFLRCFYAGCILNSPVLDTSSTYTCTHTFCTLECGDIVTYMLVHVCTWTCMDMQLSHHTWHLHTAPHAGLANAKALFYHLVSLARFECSNLPAQNRSPCTSGFSLPRAHAGPPQQLSQPAGGEQARQSKRIPLQGMLCTYVA